MQLLIDTTTERQIAAFEAEPSHAVLLSGPRGMGKTHIARLMAANLLHADLTDNPNIHVVTPVKGVIPINAVRDLNRFFRLRPAQAGTVRIALLCDADAMGREAQNALLKLLEEPPADTHLILTTSTPDELLPTIHSRLTHIAVRVPPLEAVTDYFAAPDTTSADIQKAYARAGGSIAHVASVVQDKHGNAGDEAVVAQIRQLLTATTFDRLCQVEKLSKDRAAAEQLVQTLVRMSQISLERASEQASASSLQNWRRILAASLTANEALTRRANVKLVLTDLMLSL